MTSRVVASVATTRAYRSSTTRCSLRSCAGNSRPVPFSRGKQSKGSRRVSPRWSMPRRGRSRLGLGASSSRRNRRRLQRDGHGRDLRHLDGAVRPCRRDAGGQGVSFRDPPDGRARLGAGRRDRLRGHRLVGSERGPMERRPGPATGLGGVDRDAPRDRQGSRVWRRGRAGVPGPDGHAVRVKERPSLVRTPVPTSVTSPV